MHMSAFVDMFCIHQIISVLHERSFCCC